MSIKSLYNFKNLLHRTNWWDIFVSGYQGFYHIAFQVPCWWIRIILLNESLTKWLLLKRGHNATTLELSMEEIRRHVHQFVHGTRNLWRQEQCSIKEGVYNQEYLRKTSIVSEIEYCLDVFRVTSCVHIEVY